MAGNGQDEIVDGVKVPVGVAKVKPMRPGECRSHMRRTLAREFEGIVQGFVEAAKKGSCPHVKLANELLKPVRKSPSRRKGSVVKHLEQMEREMIERERAWKEAQGAAAGSSGE
jgi:hypothetical protein